MKRAKSRHPIDEAAIARVFDDTCIGRLASTLKLPANADLKLFAEGVREAARRYAHDARVPTDNELHTQIYKLYRAAESKQYARAAVLLEALSLKARDLLNKRGSRLGLEVPTPQSLRDTAQQKACGTILKLCQYGGKYVEGRRRPTGKRSRTWRALLHAPQRIRNIAKRDAERNFVMWLQVAWLEATGTQPSLAANSERPGPFARMVRKCLALVGAGHADVVGLINELNKRRSKMKPPVRHQN